MLKKGRLLSNCLKISNARLTQPFSHPRTYRQSGGSCRIRERSLFLFVNSKQDCRILG
jgi:hypothetical protein